ncbi:hypothetical protein D9M69_707620 [compost metagenome]
MVSSTTAAPAPPLSKVMAMNCDEPANTSSDMPMACQADSPAAPARLPKMMPKGIAPSSIGSMSRAPWANSCERVMNVLLLTRQPSETLA